MNKKQKAADLPMPQGVQARQTGKKTVSVRMDQDVIELVQEVKAAYEERGQRITNEVIHMEALRQYWGSVLKSLESVD